MGAQRRNILNTEKLYILQIWKQLNERKLLKISVSFKTLFSRYPNPYHLKEAAKFILCRSCKDNLLEL